MLAAGGLPRDAPLHGLELRPGADACRSRPLASRVPRLACALPRRRADDRAAVRSTGARGRGLRRSSTTTATRQLWPYEGVWREARRLTAKSRSPYEATIRDRALAALGRRLRLRRAPTAAADAPPLADFLQRTKLGYCQHFAGTMALMLRYLGIPARVAVGFTSGTWKDGRWTVTDHDAHAWVEAWFAGHGWLTFDPTPGRGTLTATYTNASDSADAIAGARHGPLPRPSTARAARPRGGESPRRPEPTGASVPWSPIAPFAALAAALLALALAKGVRRHRRSATRDPRGRASAARAELAAFMRDQGAPVGRYGIRGRARRRAPAPRRRQ